MIRRVHRGFTLVELMVVLALIAIMSTLVVSVATTAGNPQYASVDITSTLQFARQRAIQTRRIHRVKVEPAIVSVWQSTEVGFQAPLGYEQIQTIKMPSGVVAWNAEAAIRTAPTGVDPGVDAALNFDLDFRPDGSSTGGTVLITDINAVRKFRVLAYRATGGSYLREDW